jgi:hypothetical protein
MKCERVKKLLVVFEDTAFPFEVAEHIDRCSDCRRHSQQIETVRQLMTLKKYERPEPGFEERSTLAIRLRIEDLNRQSESRLGSFWKFLTDYPRLSLRYVLATTVAALLVINFMSMPQLASMRPAEPVARLTPPPAPVSAVIPFDVYRQPSLTELQNPSNHGPTRIEYGPLESVPVNFEY